MTAIQNICRVRAALLRGEMDLIATVGSEAEKKQLDEALHELQAAMKEKAST